MMWALKSRLPHLRKLYIDLAHGICSHSHEQHNNTAFLTLPGAKYNVELVTSAHQALKDLTEASWPGIFEEDPLPLGQGATQVP